MNRPKCGCEMENGFLQTTGGSALFWVNRLMPMGLGIWKKDAQIVSQELKLNVHTIPAHICKKCRMVVGEYGSEE